MTPLELSEVVFQVVSPVRFRGPHVLEQDHSRLMERTLSKDYEGLPVTSEARLRIAMIQLLPRRLQPL